MLPGMFGVSAYIIANTLLTAPLMFLLAIGSIAIPAYAILDW